LKFLKTLFYGNLFYGFCTVALSIESNLQHGVSLNSFRFYLLIFLATILYYGRIYYKSAAVIIDDRSLWYRAHRPLLKKLLLLIAVIIVVDVFWMAWINRYVMVNMKAYYWSLLLVVPAIGLMYTNQIFPSKKLRGIGWLKPFIIGFVWAGVVTIFPVLFWQIRNPLAANPDLLLKVLLWLQNFLFISMLAVIFDIKDFKIDKKLHLNTYPAIYGIANTIKYTIIPLSVLSIIILIFTNLIYQSNLTQLLIQCIPYLLLIVIIRSFSRERNLLFYLAAVDGLMLLKAICGIVAISCF
jgi:hypothetical protein